MTLNAPIASEDTPSAARVFAVAAGAGTGTAPSAATNPQLAELLLSNIEQVLHALTNRLLEPDLLRLFAKFEVKGLEEFVDAVFDGAEALWSTVPPVDRVEPEFFARTRAAMKTGLNLYRIDDRGVRREFATGEAQGQVWQAYGAASHARFVETFTAEIAAFKPKETA